MSETSRVARHATPVAPPAGPTVTLMCRPVFALVPVSFSVNKVATSILLGEEVLYWGQEQASELRHGNTKIVSARAECPLSDRSVHTKDWAVSRPGRTTKSV